MARVPTDCSKDVMRDRLELITRLQRRWTGWVDKDGPLPAKDVDSKQFQTRNADYESKKKKKESSSQILRPSSAATLRGKATGLGGAGKSTGPSGRLSRPTSALGTSKSTKKLATPQQQRRPHSALPTTKPFGEGSRFGAVIKDQVIIEAMNKQQRTAGGAAAANQDASTADITKGELSSVQLPNDSEWYRGGSNSRSPSPGQRGEGHSDANVSPTRRRYDDSEVPLFTEEQQHDNQRRNALAQLLTDFEALIDRCNPPSQYAMHAGAHLDDEDHEQHFQTAQKQQGTFWNDVVPFAFSTFEAIVCQFQDDAVMGPLMLLLFDTCKRATFVDSPPFLVDAHAAPPTAVTHDTLPSAFPQVLSKWVDQRNDDIWLGATSHYHSAKIQVHPLLATETAAMDEQILAPSAMAKRANKNGKNDTAVEPYAERRKRMRKHFFAWHRLIVQTRVNRISAKKFADAKQQQLKLLAFMVWRWSVCQGIRERRHIDFTTCSKMLHQEEDRHSKCQTELHRAKHDVHTAKLQIDALKGDLAGVRKEVECMRSPMVFDFRKPIHVHATNKPLQQGLIHFKVNQGQKELDTAQGFFDLSFIHSEPAVALPGKEHFQGHYVIKVESSLPPQPTSEVTDNQALQWANRAIESFCEQKLRKTTSSSSSAAPSSNHHAQGSATATQAPFGLKRLQQEYTQHRSDLVETQREWEAAASKLKTQKLNNAILLSVPPTPPYSMPYFSALGMRPDLYIPLLTMVAGSFVGAHTPAASFRHPDNFGNIRNFAVTTLEKLGCLQRLDMLCDEAFEGEDSDCANQFEPFLAMYSNANTPATEGASTSGGTPTSRTPPMNPLSGGISSQVREAIHRLVVARLRGFAVMQWSVDKYGYACAAHSLQNNPTGGSLGIDRGLGSAIAGMQQQTPLSTKSSAHSGGGGAATTFVASNHESSVSITAPSPTHGGKPAPLSTSQLLDTEDDLGSTTSSLQHVGKTSGVVRQTGRTLASLVIQGAGQDHTVDTSCLEVLEWVRGVLKDAQHASIQAENTVHRLSSLTAGASPQSTRKNRKRSTTVASFGDRRASSASPERSTARSRRLQESNAFRAQHMARYVSIANMDEDFGTGLELLVLLMGEVLGVLWVPHDPDAAVAASTNLNASQQAGDSRHSSIASPAGPAKDTLLSLHPNPNDGSLSARGQTRSSSRNVRTMSPMESSLTPRGDNSITPPSAQNNTGDSPSSTQIDWVTLRANATQSPADEELKHVANLLCRAAVVELKCQLPKVVLEQLHLCAPSVKLMFLTSIYNKVHSIPQSVFKITDAEKVLNATVAVAGPVPIPTLNNGRMIPLYGKNALIDTARSILIKNWPLLYSIFSHYAMFSECSDGTGVSGNVFAAQRGIDGGPDGPTWEWSSVAAFLADYLGTISASLAYNAAAQTGVLNSPGLSSASGSNMFAAFGSSISSPAPSSATPLGPKSHAPHMAANALDPDGSFVRFVKGQTLRAFVQTVGMSDKAVRDDCSQLRHPSSMERWVWPSAADSLDSFVEKRLTPKTKGRKKRRGTILEAQQKSETSHPSLGPDEEDGEEEPEDSVSDNELGSETSNSDEPLIPLSRKDTKPTSSATSPTAAKLVRKSANATPAPSPKHGAAQEQDSSKQKQTQVKLAKMRLNYHQFAEFFMRLATFIDVKRWSERGFVCPTSVLPAEDLGTGGSAINKWCELNVDRLTNFLKSLNSRLLSQNKLAEEAASSGATNKGDKSQLLVSSTSMTFSAAQFGDSVKSGSYNRSSSPTKRDTKLQTVFIPPPAFGSLDLNEARHRLLSSEVLVVLRSEYWTTNFLVPAFTAHSLPLPTASGGAPSGWKLLEQRGINFNQLMFLCANCGIDQLGETDLACDAMNSGPLGSSHGLPGSRSNSAVLATLKGFSSFIDASLYGPSASQQPHSSHSSHKYISRLNLLSSAEYCRTPQEDFLFRIFSVIATARASTLKLANKALGPMNPMPNVQPLPKYNARQHVRLLQAEAPDKLPPAARTPTPATLLTYSGFLEYLVVLADAVICYPFLSTKDKLVLLLQHMTIHAAQSAEENSPLSSS